MPLPDCSWSGLHSDEYYTHYNLGWGQCTNSTPHINFRPDVMFDTMYGSIYSLSALVGYAMLFVSDTQHNFITLFGKVALLIPDGLLNISYAILPYSLCGLDNTTQSKTSNHVSITPSTQIVNYQDWSNNPVCAVRSPLPQVCNESEWAGCREPWAFWNSELLICTAVDS